MLVMFQMQQDRTMAINSSFTPTLRRMSTTGRALGRLKCVSWDCRTGVYMLDGPNCPFRPSKLVRFKDWDIGSECLIGDDGGFTERNIKIGGSVQPESSAVLNIDMPGILPEGVLATGRNFLSTVIREFHMVSMFLPHCVCCRKHRSDSGHLFCSECNNPVHLTNHYFPHAGCIGSCCMSTSLEDNECELCFTGGGRPCTRHLHRYNRDYGHLPVMPVEIWAEVMKYLWVPCYRSAFMEEWNNVSRDGTRLMLTVNHNTKYVMKSKPPLVFESEKVVSRHGYINPTSFRASYLDLLYLNESDDGYIENDPYMGRLDKLGADSGERMVFLNEDPMYPSGIRSQDAQTMPVFIDVQFGRTASPNESFEYDAVSERMLESNASEDDDDSISIDSN